jgi:hypothetical protein
MLWKKAVGTQGASQAICLNPNPRCTTSTNLPPLATRDSSDSEL